MNNNEKMLYESVCTNYGSLEKFFEAIMDDKAKAEAIIESQQQQLQASVAICEQYKQICESYANMSPPKFSWCWLKAKLTKNPVSI